MIDTLERPTRLADPDEVTIKRSATGVELWHGSDLLVTLPESFTDEQAMAALRFANDAHGQGYTFGRFRKAAELRSCLAEGQ